MKKIILLALSFCCFTIVNAQVSFTTQALSTNGTAGAVVDMDGDHLDDVVAVTATHINIHYHLL